MQPALLPSDVLLGRRDKEPGLVVSKLGEEVEQVLKAMWEDRGKKSRELLI